MFCRIEPTDVQKGAAQAAPFSVRGCLKKGLNNRRAHRVIDGFVFLRHPLLFLSVNQIN
jgi:hypothetical protein